MRPLNANDPLYMHSSNPQVNQPCPSCHKEVKVGEQFYREVDGTLVHKECREAEGEGISANEAGARKADA